MTRPEFTPSSGPDRRSRLFPDRDVRLSCYRRPWFLLHPHLETLWPALFRVLPDPGYQRERIATLDQDFLDLDWLRANHDRLAIISHGLEGSSQRAYVVGMARALHRRGWDVVAWNFRGCSGEINRLPRFTHNGATEDLEAVVQRGLDRGYGRIALVGFSMGGNLSLVYLGRETVRIPAEVAGAVVFSVPCDLAGSAARLAEPGNALYMRRFLREMGRKVALHAGRHPGNLSLEGYGSLRTFRDFDDRYTAPLHGFDDAEEYWRVCSSRGYLERIRRPAWIVNARNDPFLGPGCFPTLVEHGNPAVRLVSPTHGGHCGFSRFGSGGVYWSEEAAVRLLDTLAAGGKEPR